MIWIHFSKSSEGSYGGGLNKPFSHLGRIISDKFLSKNIEFPFKEIEICLAFSSLKDSEKTKEWIAKLPHYYRGKTMVRVTLLMIKQEENVADIIELIDKAFGIITSKKKKDDDYDVLKLNEAVSELRKELQETDVVKLDQKYENTVRQERVFKNEQGRVVREQANEDKKKLIYDLRFMFYLPDIELLYFSPYARRFCDNILEKLREKKFRLPGYTHLYIMVSDTFENALHHAVQSESWFVYGIAVLEDHLAYPEKQEIEKKRIVFNLIKQGLKDIAIIDKLDMKILDEVLDELEQKTFYRK